MAASGHRRRPGRGDTRPRGYPDRRPSNRSAAANSPKGPARGAQAVAAAPLSGSKRTTTDFDVGVLDTSAVESSGTRTLVSG
ncbi:hypothetical protein ABH917_000822 [Thermobifida halotolerans]